MKNNDILYELFPARTWSERYPLGNGNMGAMDNGSVSTQRISLNDDTLWSGNNEPKPLPETKIDEIRQAVFNGDITKAEELAWHNMLGEWTDAYMPLADITIKRSLQKSKAYRRALDMSKGIHTVSDNNYGAESFVSYPDKVYVFKQSGYDGESVIDVSCQLQSEIDVAAVSGGADITVKGNAPDYAAPSYHPDGNPIQYGSNGTKFAAIIRVSGDTEIVNNKVKIKGDFLLTAASATSYSSDGDLCAIALSRIQDAEKKGYNQLKDIHIKDFNNLYGRVCIDLGAQDSALPISKLFGKDKLNLSEKLFNLGRYLMISSSREGTQAANLQGIWNDKLRAPWSSNYTTNINTEMNYWNVESLNLSECHTPLFDLIRKAYEKGKRTAKEQFKCGGWVLGQNCDIWGHSDCVGGRSHYPPTCFGLFTGGSGWLISHMWEHYLYTGDKQFLADNYDIIKDAAAFYLDYVTEVDGTLYPCPSTSPENSYRKGVKTYSVDTATACDITIIANTWDIAADTCDILGKDAEFAKKLRQSVKKLPPIKIYKLGIQEYSEPYAQVDKHHRHLSHLMGLFPFNRITPDTTPELARACAKTLSVRGGAGTGWSLAWKINLNARLNNGQRAYEMIKRQLRPLKSSTVNMHRGGSYYSLLCAHPPFQIDGNFGAASGICEMLLSSHEKDTIRLLPAIPKEWKTGSFSGLKARGGITVDCKWKGGKVTYCKLCSDTEKEITLKINNESNTVSITPKQPYIFGENNQ